MLVGKAGGDAGEGGSDRARAHGYGGHGRHDAETTGMSKGAMKREEGLLMGGGLGCGCGGGGRQKLVAQELACNQFAAVI